MRAFWVGRSGLVIPGVLLVLAILLGIGLSGMQVNGGSELFGPQFFPTAALVVCVVMAVLMTVKLVLRPEPVVPESADDGPAPKTYSNWPAIGTCFGSLLVFALVLEPLGWIIAGAALFFGCVTGLGSRRYAFNLLVGLSMSSVLQLIFSGALGLTLPPGVMAWF